MAFPELQRFSTTEAELFEAPGDLGSLIARMAGAGARFPARSAPRFLEQLRACQQNRPGRLICSLLDGDPDLPLQAVLGNREPGRVIQGVILLAKLTGIARVWIVIDTALPGEWTRELCKMAAEARIRCIFIRNDYPQSDPTLLLYTLLGSRLRPGELPTDQQVLLFDGVSAWRLSGSDGITNTPFAVRDLVGNTSQYAVIPTTWKLETVLKQLQIPNADRLLRIGDPLRDMRAKPEMTVDGSDITVHMMRPERPINPEPCIRCGWCVEGCPVRIQPAGLLEAAQRKSPKLGEHFGLHACIECGICAYVCPSRLPLLDAIRSLR